MVGLNVMQDKDDEVRAAGAEALLPVAAYVAQGDSVRCQKLLSVLWVVLSDVDELSTCTGTVCFTFWLHMLMTCLTCLLCWTLW